MADYPTLAGKQVVQALRRGAFKLVRTRGSHYFMWREGLKYPVPVPVHGNRDLSIGLLRGILKQAGLTLSEFRKLL